jgi:hypothetical protein
MQEIPDMEIKRMIFNDTVEPTLENVFAELQQTSQNLQPAL